MNICPNCSEGFGFHLPWCQLPDAGLRKQTSDRACLPAAFGLVLNIEPSVVLAELGRTDDADFHVQELTWWALSRHNKVFTPLDADVRLEDKLCTAPGCDYHCKVCGGVGVEDGTSYLVVPKVAHILKWYNAVLCGRPKGKNNDHAVAWNRERQRVLDPNFTTYGLDGFHIDTAWILIEPR